MTRHLLDRISMFTNADMTGLFQALGGCFLFARPQLPRAWTRPDIDDQIAPAFNWIVNDPDSIVHKAIGSYLTFILIHGKAQGHLLRTPSSASSA